MYGCDDTLSPVLGGTGHLAGGKGGGFLLLPLFRGSDCSNEGRALYIIAR